MTIKALLRKILSYKIFSFLRKINNYRIVLNAYYYDAHRYLLHSNSFYPFNTRGKLLGQIIAEYHAIEKGICMPERRIAFGQRVISNLIDHCLLYAKHYDVEEKHFVHAVKVISEYYSIHLDQLHHFENSLVNKLKSFLAQFSYSPSQQKKITREEFLAHCNDSFENFARSRHSLRNFSGKVEMDILVKAIDLAQTAPSSCNRQPSRVYILTEKETIAKALSLQNGNRGFGHLADKLLIVTEDLNYFLSISERNEAYINGGMFSLNLLYALHYYGVGACPLNWCAEKEQDIALRKLCNIPDNEIIMLMIAVGGIPQDFMLAASPRNEVSTIIKMV